jgi:hypothetical protein
MGKSCSTRVVAQTCYIPGRELELTATLPPSPLQGGAIYVRGGGTCNIDGASFVSNTAGGVSQQRKKPSLTECSKSLPGISQLFFSFLTFLLLFAQYGGAIANYGTLHVTLANFTRNQAGGNVSRAAPAPMLQ